MEIIPLKKNEIIIDYKNELMYKIVNYTNSSLKNEKYGNFKDLDHTKARLDLLDKNLEKVRRAAAKYLHEYELVKLICKKNVISRAYFKLYEMIYHEPIVYTNECNCFFICEAPGGFIECITDIRRKKNLRTKFISISNMDNLIKYDLIPNAKTAIKIAEAVWLPIYGKKIYKEKPFIAKLNSSKIWIVEGSVYVTKGGAAYIEIQKKDGKILKVYHEK